MTTRLHGVADLSNIRSTVLGRRKEMKHRTVVPHVVSSALELCFRDIGNEPMDLFCGQTQPLLGHVDSGLRNIEDGDVLMAPCQEVIDGVDSPPPTSIMDAEYPAAARSISASDVSRCAQYQLTASAAFVL